MSSESNLLTPSNVRFFKVFFYTCENVDNCEGPLRELTLMADFKLNQERRHLAELQSTSAVS